ncbi:MAG: response regulator [Opitutaceae bacterium]|nr:response regulator [Opitutaceae bacterium]
MRYKILTVDDSKTVRIIVKKAFRTFDCEIIEASNGVEGLAAAAKERPDVILLDFTMPVMDGVEMLTKLKSDPTLKAIPVMMLTAEGGRDNVLKIAKIGVRDYIVKPFREEVLVEKVGRVIDLKPLCEGPLKAKSILDSATILVVEDKPAIVQQIQEGLKHTPWKITGVATTNEAIDFCSRNQTDLVIISLSLPDDSAFTLFGLICTNVKTKYTPVFGLVVKTELHAQQQAQQVGFTSIVTKPLDIPELEAKMSKAMNLDTSQRYFSTDQDVFVLKMPEVASQAAVNEMLTYLKPKMSEAVDGGICKVVLDLRELRRLDMIAIKALLQAIQHCREFGLQYLLVGNSQIISECKGFEDTKAWTFVDTMEEARNGFSRSNSAVSAQPAAVGA